MIRTVLLRTVQNNLETNDTLQSERFVLLGRQYSESEVPFVLRITKTKNELGPLNGDNKPYGWRSWYEKGHSRLQETADKCN